MRIRLLVSLGGNLYTLGPGDEHDFPDWEATRLIEAGYAVLVTGTPFEQAVVRRQTAERRGRKDKTDVVPSDSADSG